MENSKNTIQKKFIGAGRFDSVNSTYQHKINLCNGKQLTGYSKGLLSKEMSDKTVLLERVILRLYNNSYLVPNRVQSIEFFLNNQFESNELILILRPHNYSFANNIEYAKDERLYTFLQRLYEQLRSGIIITKSLGHKPVIKQIDTILNPSKKVHETEQELHEFLMKCRKEGIEEGQIFNYYFNYRSKWFE
jgi:hypothetical protein